MHSVDQDGFESSSALRACGLNAIVSRPVWQCPFRAGSLPEAALVVISTKPWVLFISEESRVPIPRLFKVKEAQIRKMSSNSRNPHCVIVFQTLGARMRHFPKYDLCLDCDWRAPSATYNKTLVPAHIEDGIGCAQGYGALRGTAVFYKTATSRIGRDTVAKSATHL
jgi:hypothetical protein